jgi:rhodanese-related sulfurtransferase
MAPVLKRTLLLFFLSALMALAIWAVHPGMPRYAEGKLGEGGIFLSQLSDDDSILWIDARSEEEFNDGHIPGAVILSLDDFDEQIESVMSQYDSSRITVIYCSEDRCQTSQKIAEILKREFDLENIYFLEGGWEAWQEAHK